MRRMILAFAVLVLSEAACLAESVWVTSGPYAGEYVKDQGVFMLVGSEPWTRFFDVTELGGEMYHAFWWDGSVEADTYTPLGVTSPAEATWYGALSGLVSGTDPNAGEGEGAGSGLDGFTGAFAPLADQIAGNGWTVAGYGLAVFAVLWGVRKLRAVFEEVSWKHLGGREAAIERATQRGMERAYGRVDHANWAPGDTERLYAKVRARAEARVDRGHYIRSAKGQKELREVARRAAADRMAMRDAREADRLADNGRWKRASEKASAVARYYGQRDSSRESVRMANLYAKRATEWGSGRATPGTTSWATWNDAARASARSGRGARR